MTDTEQRSISQYLDELRSSDPQLTRNNAIDLIVLQFAVTVNEAAAAYDAWKPIQK